MANSQWKVDAGNYLFKVGSDVENIKGTATLKVAEYIEKTSNACAPKVQLNYLRPRELMISARIPSKQELPSQKKDGSSLLLRIGK